MRLVAKALPYSVIAEQYRVAATRLALGKGKERSTVVAVSSALQGEGKTTTVVNLGYTLARDMSKRTVLVDCDFKRPSLGEYLKPVPLSGLADCLRNGISVDECLFSFPEVPCWIMPVGKCEDVSNELLRTDRLNGIFDQLRERFEYILINAPPILPVADMNVLANIADELLLVIRAGSTPRSSFCAALNNLRVDKPIHFVLNGAGGRSLPHYIGDYQQVPYGKELG
jgi:Mrp family chromosome partitioning ATPase